MIYRPFAPSETREFLGLGNSIEQTPDHSWKLSDVASNLRHLALSGVLVVGVSAGVIAIFQGWFSVTNDRLFWSLSVALLSDVTVTITSGKL